LQTDVIRNYDSLIPMLKKYGINYVDGHQITSEQKTINKYGMFPEGGTHWNKLAAIFTAQKAVEQIKQWSGKNLGNIEISRIDVDQTPIGFDRDLANSVNIWFPRIKYLTPIPVITKKTNDTLFKPTILMEGGSFSFNFIDRLNESNIFKSLDLYYYYNKHYVYNEGEIVEGNKDGNIVGDVSNIDWNNNVFNRDIVIVELNEQAIPNMGSGFVQDALINLKPLQLKFSNVNNLLVQQTEVDGKVGYIFKKGANGSSTLYLQSDQMKLESNMDYTLSYKAKGFYLLKTDLYPDDLPELSNNSITSEVKEFTYTINSNSPNMKSASLRFFIDGLSLPPDKDTLIYDIKLTKNQK
jgi:hypothetical protein